jgi:hypothetical protein
VFSVPVPPYFVSSRLHGAMRTESRTAPRNRLRAMKLLIVKSFQLREQFTCSAVLMANCLQCCLAGLFEFFGPNQHARVAIPDVFRPAPREPGQLGGASDALLDRSSTSREAKHDLHFLARGGGVRSLCGYIRHGVCSVIGTLMEDAGAEAPAVGSRKNDESTRPGGTGDAARPQGQRLLPRAKVDRNERAASWE